MTEQQKCISTAIHLTGDIAYYRTLKMENELCRKLKRLKEFVIIKRKLV